MTTIVGAIIAGFAVLAAAWYAGRESKKSAQQTRAAQKAIELNQAQVDKLRADSAAIELAQRIYRQTIADLHDEMAQLQTALTDSSAKVARLQRSVDSLTQLLQQHNIPIPANGGRP